MVVTYSDHLEDAPPLCGIVLWSADRCHSQIMLTSQIVDMLAQSGHRTTVFQGRSQYTRHEDGTESQSQRRGGNKLDRVRGLAPCFTDGRGDQQPRSQGTALRCSGLSKTTRQQPFGSFTGTPLTIKLGINVTEHVARMSTRD